MYDLQGCAGMGCPDVPDLMQCHSVLTTRLARALPGIGLWRAPVCGAPSAWPYQCFGGGGGVSTALHPVQKIDRFRCEEWDASLADGMSHSSYVLTPALAPAAVLWCMPSGRPPCGEDGRPGTQWLEQEGVDKV